jgi:hypothetical protein
MPTKKTSNKAAAKTPTKKTMSKADFVRAHANLSPKEIVAKAKEQGIHIGVPYVYNVRAYDKANRTKSAGVAAHRAGRVGPAAARSIAASSSAEALLKAVAAEVGLARAIEILQGERARVHSVLRG